MAPGHQSARFDRGWDPLAEPKSTCPLGLGQVGCRVTATNSARTVSSTTSDPARVQDLPLCVVGRLVWEADENPSPTR